MEPVINTLNAPYWEAAAQGVLMLPRCLRTGRMFWPPAPVSPLPGGGPVAWEPAVQAGRLEALAVYHRPFQKAFARLVPYGIGMVRLDDGPCLHALLARPEEAGAPRCGDRVTLGFRDRAGMARPVLCILGRQAEGAA